MGESRVWRYRLLYLSLFSAYGVLSPYLPVFFHAVHMSKSQIGVLSMLPNVSSFMVAPLIGYIGDKLHAHGELILSGLLISTVLSTVSLYVRGFLPLFGINLLKSITAAPLTPQVDSMVISSLDDPTTYGSFRLWGAIGFGIFSFLAGLVTPTELRVARSEEYSWSWLRPDFKYIFYCYAVLCAFAGAIVLSLKWADMQRNWQRLVAASDRGFHVPVGESEESITLPDVDCAEDYEENDEGHTQQQQQRSKTFKSDNAKTSEIELSSHFEYEKTHNSEKQQRDAQQQQQPPPPPPPQRLSEAMSVLFREHPEVLVFGVVVFLSGCGAGVIYSYLFLFLKELGGTGVVMGTARFITCAAEVPMFQLAGKLQSKYGTWPVIVLTQFAFVMRFVYYAMLTSPWAVLPCEVLNGLTFAVTWSVCCTYANQIAPPNCHAFMQAVLEGLHFGIGNGCGSLIGGIAYDYFGARVLFAASAVLAAVSCGLALITWRLIGSHGSIKHSSSSSSSDDDVSLRADQLSLSGDTADIGNSDCDEEGEEEEEQWNTQDDIAVV